MICSGEQSPAVAHVAEPGTLQPPRVPAVSELETPHARDDAFHRWFGHHGHDTVFPREQDLSRAKTYKK